MTSFDQLRRRIAEFNAARDWHQFHTPKNLAMAICGEAGELAAELQWLDAGSIRERLAEEDLHARLASEAADILVYLISFAEVCDIDLIEAVSDKLEINARRYPTDLARGSTVKYSRLQAGQADDELGLTQG